MTCRPLHVTRPLAMAADDRWWGARARLQVSSWRGRADIVVLSPVPDRPAPRPSDISHELDQLRRTGVVTVHTGALHRNELGPFLDAGFVERERLHLLRHELGPMAEPSPTIRLRRAWRRDHPAILEIDQRAFDEFWALDRRGLDDAVRATPTARFRVAQADGIVGYAITGRAGERGYLQRLAVDPSHHRAGVGRALVEDSLRWLRRTGARMAIVNTQESNAGALALYLATGFVREPQGLTVLACDLRRTTW